ncbi:NADH-quinone oxidoreductase subunit G [Actinomycetes bacterium M1A6_2h]
MSEEAATEKVTLTIDGISVSVPKGTLVIRAAEEMGVQIPRFCDHPLLAPVGACRQCLVEVEGQRKPLASCTTTVAEGMVVKTQHSSPDAAKAQAGVMELLLINHPLDCPVCDKGGECPLQNQAMSSGRPESRFEDVKRTYPKPIPLSSQVLLDRERCVLCARCTRFSDQIAGDPFIELLERGALQQVGIYGAEPFESYFSGNTVQVCPVGALTGTSYRFRARPFDLVSTPSTCEHCASGCAQRTDHRRGTVLRRLAGDDPSVNEEWNCDKGRWAFAYTSSRDRITSPMVRHSDGSLREASWSEAMDVAARGLADTATGVLVGGRTSYEDAYAYAKFARTVLHTNDIDFRSRPHSAEESAFLAARIAGRPMDVTYEHLDAAPAVLLVALEPEEESPIVFLRLRKAVRTASLVVHAVAPFTSRGLDKLGGRLVRTVPGAEPAAIDSIRTSEVGEALRAPGSLILVGERAAEIAGALTAVAALADATGARIAWIPRRAGERGALEAGALPGLLPGGRPTTDPAARSDVAALWKTSDLPAVVGRDTDAMLSGLGSGELGALVVGGIEIDDLPDPDAARAALSGPGFVVSLEIRTSAVTDLADVVFPVAATTEKKSTFLDWEGRVRPSAAALPSVGSLPDHRVLHALAHALGVDLNAAETDDVRAEMDELGTWSGARRPDPSVRPAPGIDPGPGEAILAGWRMLLDSGRAQDGEPNLAGTARTPVVRMSAATAAELYLSEGEPVEVSSGRGSITLPLAVSDLPDRVVWLPVNSPGSAVRRRLASGSGETVRIRPARDEVR